MRIAQIAPVFESVPPRGYGGTERVVSYLTETLVELGHQVTLFATGDSVTSADLVSVCDHGLRAEAERAGAAAWQTLTTELVFERAAEFDVMHFHVDFMHFPLARRCSTPSLTTLHGRLDHDFLLPFHRYFAEHPLVSISDHQRRGLPGVNFASTVHHGVPAGLYDFAPQPRDYFAFVGRMSREKRFDRAVEIAAACNTRLVVAAKIDDADRAYFESELRPLMAHPLVDYIGEVDDAAKNKLLGGARALLFPIDWPEPFGLVVIEALACGTPVIAYRHGSVPELLEHGVTGYIVENQADAIEAARNVDRIDRGRCRRVFEERFTSTAMAQRYLAVYRNLIGRQRRPEAELLAAK